MQRSPSALATHKRHGGDTCVLRFSCDRIYDFDSAIPNAATLYSLVKQVAYILKLPHTLHPTLAPSLKRVKTKDPEKHKYDNVPPEVALMATIIIVVKMTYGLDGRPR